MSNNVCLASIAVSVSGSCSNGDAEINILSDVLHSAIDLLNEEQQKVIAQAILDATDSTIDGGDLSAEDVEHERAALMAYAD